jgi:hypothetical protein
MGRKKREHDWGRYNPPLNPPLRGPQPSPGTDPSGEGILAWGLDAAKWHRQVIADCERGIKLAQGICPECDSKGFSRSPTGKGCTFCDGSGGGL